MSTFSENLIARRQRQNLTQEELAAKTGYSVSSITAWERGLNLPTTKKLQRLAEVLATSSGWLLGETTAGGAGMAPVVVQGQDSPAYKANAGKIVPVKELLPQRIPVVSWAAAGKGGNYADLADQIDEFLNSDCTDPNAYALIIEGDSMLPQFEPGDRVIFMPNCSPQNGDVVVARLVENGQVYFKLFHLTGKRAELVRLTSYNQAYPPLEYAREEFRFIHPMHSLVRRRRR